MAQGMVARLARSLLVADLIASLAIPRAMAAGPISLGTGGMMSVPGSTSIPSGTATEPAYSDNPAGGSDNFSLGADGSAFARDISGPGSGGRPGLMNAESAGLGGKGAEYYSGYYQGAVMIPVMLIGAVGRPGLHYIPTRTSLLKFLVLAGGTSPEAVTDEITIKRLNGDDTKEQLKEELIKVDGESALAHAGSRGPILQQYDLVNVPYKKPWVSNNTLLVVGLVSTLLGVVVSGIVISNQLKDK
jgi:hypothetical protein